MSRSVYLIMSGRLQEGLGVLRQALALSEEHDLPTVALRARTNLVQISIERNRLEEAKQQAGEGLALARQRGDRLAERVMLGQLLVPLSIRGEWDEAMHIGRPQIAGPVDLDASQAALFLMPISLARGDEAVRHRCVEIAQQMLDSAYVDLRFGAADLLARDSLDRGHADEALKLAWGALEADGISADVVHEGYAVAVDAAIALDDEVAMGELEAWVEALPPARVTPLIRASQARLRAEGAHRRGDADESSRREEEAITLLRSVGARPLLVKALVERGRRHDDSEALSEARGICEELGATRWLEQIEQAAAAGQIMHSGKAAGVT